ncbi:MAG: type II secretion system F family protein [Candidatus Methanomethylicus sp.]|nr:type II secretion system F family protein [Candidatus Methanomethylicus sp.]
MEKKKKQYIWISEATAGTAIGLYAAFIFFSNSRLADYLILIAIVVGITPLAILSIMENRWKAGIERRIPELLEDIAEGQLTGLTFLRAIEASAMKDHGPVTIELRRILAHVKIGGTIEEGFEDFANRVQSRMVKRASGIMVETTKSGGDVAKIIRSLASYLRQVESINDERKATMKTYIVIVYIAFGVFMATVVILLNQFFYPMLQMGSAIFKAQGDYLTYRRIFFYMALLQALFSGLVAGKLGEGFMAAGFKHSIVMMLMSLVIFILIIVG